MTSEWSQSDNAIVGDAYNKFALVLQVGERVSPVVDYILASYQPDFAVMEGGKLIGIVTRTEVLRALAAHPADAMVTDIMQREVLKLDANKTLEDVRAELSQRAVRIAAVYEGEGYMGLVSLEDIAEALAVQTFVRRQTRVGLAQTSLKGSRDLG